MWAREPHGAWDAWMTYNRDARFIYRDQSGWLKSFSHQMDPIFHSDYPLQLGMDTAWAWQAVGQETQRTPIVLSGLFMLACAGLLGSSLNLTKSLGQASIALILLLGSSLIGNEGAAQRADLPLAYFFLGTTVPIYLYSASKKPGLLILAGFMAGCAAWTKNEGSLFALDYITCFIYCVPSSKSVACARMVFAWFGFSTNHCSLFQKISRAAQRCAEQRHHTLDPTSAGCIAPYHYLEIFWRRFPFIWRMGNRHRAILMVYALIFKLAPSSDLRPAYLAIGLILILQAIGYYGIYLITPYDLQWHVDFSLESTCVSTLRAVSLFILYNRYRR